MVVAAALSQKIGVGPAFRMLTSRRMLRWNMISLAVSASAASSASAVDVATVVCLELRYHMGPPASDTMEPLVLMLVETSPAKSESECPTRPSLGPLRYVIPRDEVPLR